MKRTRRAIRFAGFSFSSLSWGKQDGLELPALQSGADRFGQAVHIRNERARLGDGGILPERNKVIIAAIEQHAEVSRTAGQAVVGGNR